MRLRSLAVVTLTVAWSSHRALAQTPPITVRLGVNAVAAAIRDDPVPGGHGASQVVLEEPVVMARLGAWHDQVALQTSLDLEGLTMPDGVLTLGGWGEGFIDRRHPHSYVHELILTATHRFTDGSWPLSGSVAVGKGFVAFGSDDPMNRPALAFPVNHHWSQILERAVATAGLRAGPLTLEASLFNGDEPEFPGQWPRVARFGDSWAGRATVALGPDVQAEASLASVKSPEHRPGAGTDQRKAHTSIRLDRPLGGGRLSGLAEWARTSEADGFFVFHSILGEAGWTGGGYRVYYRFELTDRPEEERTLDPFRSLRPHLENSILGTTRWAVHTAGVGFVAATVARMVRLEPILELGYARVEDRGGGIFRAGDWYGRTNFWSATLAVRAFAGMGHRMGRYGVAAEASESHPMRMP